MSCFLPICTVKAVSYDVDSGLSCDVDLVELYTVKAVSYDVLLMKGYC